MKIFDAFLHTNALFYILDPKNADLAFLGSFFYNFYHNNEFMIYFVGYNQKQITSYMHKLNKNFKTLPFNYGISISYSMIESDTKSIEDAINECVEDIKKQKGKKDEDK